MSTDFTALLNPRRIAVIGASRTQRTHANRFIRRLVEQDYDGAVFPVHPSAREIEGLPAIPSLNALDEPVDFAFIAVPAAQVPDLLRAAKGKARFAQVMSAGFAEAAHGQELDADLREAVSESGIRVLGPNCMGIQLPRAGLSMTEGTTMRPGGIAFLSQSGSLCLDLLQRGEVIGLDFNAVISMGNCADLKPSELAAHLLADSKTTVLAMYLEQEPTGRALFEAMRANGADKPIVVLKGGRSQQGQRAAASHTGALISDDRVWNAMIRQAGAVQAEDQEDLTLLLAGLRTYRPPPPEHAPNERVILFGNGGGTGVIAADLFARNGLSVGPLPARLAAKLSALGMPDGASVANPIDVPAMIMVREDGAATRRIIANMFAEGGGAAIVIYLSLRVLANYDAPAIIATFFEAILEARAALGGAAPTTHLVLRSDGSTECETMKREIKYRADEVGITVLDELGASARVLGAIHQIERWRYRRNQDR